MVRFWRSTCDVPTSDSSGSPLMRMALRAEALGRAVSVVGLGIGAVDLDELCVVHSGSEGTFDRFEVEMEPVRGELDAASQTGLEVVHHGDRCLT